ncbi:MAG: BatA domain-containing protein, partial [Bacteroidetes bacterium]|nr:BatA domain-containing protein [Bacteroidota bacterium]
MNFVYPEFLFALSAILIPIIIHLFNFRRYKTIYFTNVQFLKEVQQESTARSRLKHLLILASRILAIAFLVFAFSQPYIPADQTEKKQGPKAVSIYLDNSFSMGALAAEQSLLELAKKKAHEIIRGYKETDKFQLLTNDFFGQQQRLMGKDEFLSQLEKVTLTPDVKPLSQVIQRQKQALGKADAENLFSFIISDFQKSTSDIDKIKIDSTMETYFVQISSVSKR